MFLYIVVVVIAEQFNKSEYDYANEFKNFQLIRNVG